MVKLHIWMLDHNVYITSVSMARRGGLLLLLWMASASACVNGEAMSSWVDPGVCLLKGRGLFLAEELRNTSSVELQRFLG